MGVLCVIEVHCIVFGVSVRSPLPRCERQAQLHRLEQRLISKSHLAVWNPSKLHGQYCKGELLLFRDYNPNKRVAI